MRESFNGGFVLAQPAAGGERRMFGPYEVDGGRQAIMRSATGMTPAEATHLAESEMCATCHTLYTQALGPEGKVLGELPEQVPYLEWRHSAFREERSCQSCHMPEIAGPTRRGNDNDADASRFEPHHTEIRSGDQVQVYESVMHDLGGDVTTGLLRATGYIKDNRLLPRGFDKATALPDIAVRGGAQQDPDFTAESDRVRYVVNTAGRSGPFAVSAELRYQPISFRWAQNLRALPDRNSSETVTPWLVRVASARVASMAVHPRAGPGSKAVGYQTASAR